MEGWRFKIDGCVWSGGKEGAGRVAVLIASKWQEEVMEVKRVDERILLVRIRVRKGNCACCNFIRHRWEDQWWTWRSSMKRVGRC